MAQDNIARLKAAHDAFSTGALDQAQALAAPTIRFTDHGRNILCNTSEEFRGWMESHKASSSDMHIVDAQYSAGDSWVTARFRAVGTQDGPLGPFPPSGKSFSIEVCEVWHFNDAGLADEAHDYSDAMGVMVQLGHLCLDNPNVPVIHNLYAAFGRGDVPAVLACVDEAATWGNLYGQRQFPGQWGKPCKGHAEIVGFFEAIFATVEVHGFEPQEFIVQGDKVVVPIRWHGVVRESGKSFDTLIVHLWTLRNGKVIDYIGLDDPTCYSFCTGYLGH